MTSSSLANDYNTKKKMVPVYKTKHKPQYWSLNEDDLLIEKILKIKNGSGYVAVEALRESEVDWVNVGGQASWSERGGLGLSR